MSYDQGYWHQEGCAERNIDEKYAGTHIAVYLKWCMEKGFLASTLEASDTQLLTAVRSGSLPVSQYFEENLDWKFGDWCLNERGNAFTTSYYDSYLSEVSVRVPSAVLGPEEGVDFQQLFQLLDERLTQFQELGPKNVPWKKKNPRWKFW
jgi:hypothetical protein